MDVDFSAAKVERYIHILTSLYTKSGTGVPESVRALGAQSRPVLAAAGNPDILALACLEPIVRLSWGQPSRHQRRVLPAVSSREDIRNYARTSYHLLISYWYVAF